MDGRTGVLVRIALELVTRICELSLRFAEWQRALLG
jgi:hypothetical protein